MRKFKVGDIVKCKYAPDEELTVVELERNHIDVYLRLKSKHCRIYYDHAYYDRDVELVEPFNDGGRASIDAGAEEYEMIMRTQDGAS